MVAELTENANTLSAHTQKTEEGFFFVPLVCPKFLAKILVFALVLRLYKQRKRLTASFVAARLCLHMENSAFSVFNCGSIPHTHTDE